MFSEVSIFILQKYCFQFGQHRKCNGKKNCFLTKTNTKFFLEYKKLKKKLKTNWCHFVEGIVKKKLGKHLLNKGFFLIPLIWFFWYLIEFSKFIQCFSQTLFYSVNMN